MYYIEDTVESVKLYWHQFVCVQLVIDFLFGIPNKCVNVCILWIDNIVK